MLKNKQIVVECDECKDVMAFSDKLTQEEADKMIKGLRATAVFNAPRCHNPKCNSFEPYSDINMAHTITIVDYQDRRLPNYENI